MSEKLLPCPFCGGEATIQQDTRYPRYGKKDTVKAYEPICINPSCLIYKADSIYFLSEKEAITAWNNRTQPNEPLSLDELKQMDGCPVWTVTNGVEGSGRWEIVDSVNDKYIRLCNPADESYDCKIDTYTKTWLAYRNKPEEGAE